MKEILIGSSAIFEVLEEKLRASFEESVEVDMNITQPKEKTPGFIEMALKIQDRIKETEIISKVGEVLADLIQTDYARHLISQDLKKRECYLSEQSISHLTEDILTNIKKDVVTYYGIWPSKEVLSSALREYLRTAKRLFIDGFVEFRLREYTSYLKQFIDVTLERYLSEVEQREFIRLLKYFVEMQSVKIDEVHLVKNHNGAFAILDGDYEVISDDYCEDLLGVKADFGQNFEDLLISALITLSPSKINIHMEMDLSVLNTIKGVFGDRVKICEGCELIECEKCTFQEKDQTKDVPLNPEGLGSKSFFMEDRLN